MTLATLAVGKFGGDTHSSSQSMIPPTTRGITFPSVCRVRKRSRYRDSSRRRRRATTIAPSPHLWRAAAITKGALFRRVSKAGPFRSAHRTIHSPHRQSPRLRGTRLCRRDPRTTGESFCASNDFGCILSARSHRARLSLRSPGATRTPDQDVKTMSACTKTTAHHDYAIGYQGTCPSRHCYG